MNSFRISRLEAVCLSPRSGEMSGGSFPQDLFHRLPFRELIDQLVQIPYFFISGSAISSTRTPHTTPLMSELRG